MAREDILAGSACAIAIVISTRVVPVVRQGWESLDMQVKVVYALPHRQWIVEVPWEAGMTALQAVQRSGMLDAHPGIGDRELVLGLFGTEIEQHHPLKDGDRVEICRPLELDPREMRRRAVATGRFMGQPD